MSSEAVAVLEIEGKQFPLKAGKNYLIGRKRTTTTAVEKDVTQLDIELESQTLDAKHALLRVNDEEIRILDLYSKLGTFLNGQRLEGLLELKIDTSGRLQLGEAIGSLQFNTKLQSHDSNGFHDGHKNTSDIICSSPEPATLSGTRLKHLQKSSLTSTPNVNQPEAIFSDDLNTQCNFLIPPVPESKSSVVNKSRSSLTPADATLNSSANSSSVAQQNKSVDSFCIPETQQYPGRPSLENNSTTHDVSVAVTDASGADSLLNKCGVDDDDEVDDQDFCIPETQEVMPGIVSSQAHKRFQAERAVLDANLPANMFVEEDENFAAHEGGSQFRICTQDFNDVDCFNDERSNDSDLLADQACSLIIPRITHEAAAMPVNAGKEEALSDQKEQSIHDVEEISAQNCSEQGAKTTLLEEALEQREGSCTPDLFELPADQSINEANEVNDIAAVPCQATNTNEGGTKVPIELPSTSFKLPTIPVTDVASIFEDDDDLMPTQVFSIKPPAKDPKKVTAGKCSPEYLTLSDKENILPAAAAAMLEAAVDLMQPTQVFDLNIISDEELFMTTTTTVTRIESTTNTAAQAAPDPPPQQQQQQQQQQPPQPADEDDDDLLPTQVFPSGESNTARAGEKTPTNKFLSSTLLSTSSRETSSAALTACAKMETTEMPPPPLQKAPSLTNASYSESPDIDLLLCTPQIIATNFGKSDVKPKLTLLDKQKTLFGDDSDEAVDVMELIDAPPKVPHDFDKLLPHLTKPNESPKREEVEAKLHHYNRSFGERGGEVPKGKNKSKEEQRRVTRNRDERHLERDKQRERKDESDATNEKKAAEGREKRNEKKAENATATNEKNDKQRDKKLEDAKTNEKNDKQRDKRTTNSASNEKKIEENKKQTRSSRAATRSAEKIEQKQEESSTAKRTDRKRKNTETASAAELPPRRLTRQKSRVEGELITEPPKPTEATSRRTRRKTKDDEHEQKGKRDVTPKEVAATKRKKLSASSSQSSTSSSSNKESNSQASKTANKESNSQVDKSANKDSNSQVGKSTKRDSNSQERKSAKRDSNSQERKSTAASKSDEAITASQERRQTRYRSTASLVSTSQGSSSAQASPATPIATNTTPDDASDAQTKLRKPKQIQVSMTMVDPEHFQNLAKNAADIWTVAKDPVESDILIMDKGNRTFKFLIAMAKGIPIVTSKWLEKVNNSGQIVNMTDHLYTDEAFERRHKFSLLKSIHMARKQKLFADRHFIMTPGIRPQPSELEAIIKCAGGSVHTDVPTTLKNNQKLYLVSSKDEKKLWHKYRRLTSQISIISSEGVMAAVMRQVVKPLETNILA